MMPRSQNGFGCEKKKKFQEEAFGLKGVIEEELELYNLNFEEVGIDVTSKKEGEEVYLDWEIETQPWVEEDGETGLDEPPVSTSGSYKFTIDLEELYSESSKVRYESIHYILTEILTDNFGDAAIRYNDEVIQESLSPEYDHF